jgi:hypothetical protein
MGKVAGTVILAGLVGLMSGCGNGGGLSTDSNGELSLHITDAPVDNATNVVIQFSGVQLQRAGGSRIDHTFDSVRNLNLLALQGGERITLLDNVSVPSGNYSWIRLLVNAERDVLDSYITLNGGGQFPLFIPSGSESGLQLSGGLTVPARGSADFTIDFDLRKSITAPSDGSDNYILRPSLRLIDSSDAGRLSGEVDPSLMTDGSCTNGATHDIGNAVYLYTGHDATLDDIDGGDGDPLVSANINLTNNTYTIGFLTPGDYTVAFTCQGADDDPEEEDEIDFVGAANVTIAANATSEHDF